MFPKYFLRFRFFNISIGQIYHINMIKCALQFQRKLNQHCPNHYFTFSIHKYWFLMRGENRSTRRKTFHSRVENQQTQSTYDTRDRNRTRATSVESKCSHHQTNPATFLTYIYLEHVLASLLFLYSIFMTPRICIIQVLLFKMDICSYKNKINA